MSSSTTDPKLVADPVLHSVLDDVATIRGAAEQIAQRHVADQLLARENLFGRLETDGHRLICYVSAPTAGGSIDYSDAAPIGSMLDLIGDVECIDLLIHSPGGSGEVAEKLVEMCRSRCQQFRVIVPNLAKSAATMIALGGDVIVMGDPSELGPTDPQYEISIGGVSQMISGQSFIQAYDDAQEQIKDLVVKNEPAVDVLHSLSATTMEPAFIEHCRRGVAFSQDVAARFLRKYQLPAMFEAMGETRHPNTIRARAKRAADNLLSANTRFSHGRLIGATDARDDVGLHVEILDRNDPVWEAYWELYVRAEVYMQTATYGDRRPVKLFFDRTSILPSY